MTLQIQGRSSNNEHNDTLHLYEDNSKTPLCSSWQPRRPHIDPITEVTAQEAYDNDYFQHDGEIRGKICGKCQNVMRMSNDYEVE